jgi:hypothetical protein
MTIDLARVKARHSAYQWRMPCWIVLDRLGHNPVARRFERGPIANWPVNQALIVSVLEMQRIRCISTIREEWP